jgi:hypothetical protein
VLIRLRSSKSDSSSCENFDVHNAVYILSMTPEKPNRIKDLFREGSNTVARLLESPTSLRSYGWDLQTRDHAHIENGEYLELNNGRRKQLRLYEDGTFIVRGSIDESFLGWARHDEEFSTHPQLHPIAVIEFTMEFVRLYGQIVPFFEASPERLVSHVEIAHGKIGNRLLSVVPGGWAIGSDPYQLKQQDPQYTGSMVTRDLLIDPQRIACELVDRLFLFFSVPINRVPYTFEQEGVRRVDVEKIAKA